MAFNWITGVEGDINDKDHQEEESYIEVEENTNEINPNDLNDQDSNYDSIPLNVPHSHKKIYADEVNNLQDIYTKSELNDKENLINEDELNNINELNNLLKMTKISFIT